MQREARNREKRCFGALCVWLRVQCAQDQLISWTNCPLLIATHSDFYASTLRMQGEARYREERRFGALRARLRVQCAQDWLISWTNCSLLIATHRYFYASTLKNARGSQKLQKQGVWCHLRAIVRTARAGSAWNFDQMSTTYCYT